MELNKFQKIIWSINGILIMGTFLLVAIFASISFFEYKFRDRQETSNAEEFEEAKKKGLIAEGLDYGSPVKVYGADGYILPVTLKTFAPGKNEIRSSGSSSEYEAPTLHNAANVIFLDHQFNVTRKLLNRKGFIDSFKYPGGTEDDYGSGIENPDTTVHNISYLIGFADSNNDGLLDENDKSDLYLTDLNGNNFTQVTKDVDILSYEFMSPNEILIQYYSRADKREEKNQLFARYLIKEKKFEFLTQLNETLGIMEKELSQ